MNLTSRKKFKKFQKAFTLIEVLIYTAIFSVVAAGIMGVAWNITRLHTTQIASNEVDENLRYIMNLVNSKVRKANIIKEASSTTLVLEMPDSTKSPVTFSLSNGVLYMQEGTAEPVAITSNRVVVQSLTFQKIEVAGAKGGVKINITLAYKEPTGTTSFSREFFNTVTKVNAITFDSDILPDENNLRNVGLQSLRWKNGYFSGDVNVTGGNVTASGYIIGTTGLCMGTDCRTSWGAVSGVSGSGTQNYISKWTSSGAIGNSQIFDNGTNVGIGTTSPGGKLHVVGASGVGRSVMIDDREIKFRGDGVAHFSIYGPDTGKSYLTIQNTSASGGPGTVGTDLLTITSGGNVGIGTTSPNAKLSITTTGTELGGTAASAALRTNAGALGTTAGNTLKLASIGFTSSNQISLGIEALRAANGTDWTTTAIGLKMDVDGTSPVNNAQIWIKADGNVGIGTTNPGHKLEVSGTGALTGLNVLKSGYNSSITNDFTTTGVSYPRSFGLGIMSGIGYTGDIAVTQPGWSGGYGGYIGLWSDVNGGTESGTNVVGVVSVPRGTGSGSAFGLYTNLANAGTGYTRWGVYSTGEDKNYFSGNVGIGTTSPGAKLDVRGSVVIQGDLSPYLQLKDAGGNTMAYIGNNNKLFVLGGDYVDDQNMLYLPSPMKIRVGNDGVLSVNEVSGKVGIGTTSPAQALEVNGSIRLSSYLQIKDYDTGGWDGTSVGSTLISRDYTTMFWHGGVVVGSYTNNAVPSTYSAIGAFLTKGPTALAVSSGNVGIGTTAPGAKLSVNGGVGIGSSYAGTSVSDGVLIISNNVGIGTTSPGYKLDVAGDIHASGTVYANYFSGTMSGTVPAAQVSSGVFGANVGNGNFTFPADLYVTGNVGIGTTSPSQKLHLYTSSGDIGLKLSTTAPINSTSSGPNSPSAATTDSSNGGTVNWISPTSVYSSDNVYATAALGSNVISYYLKATGFGFAIPSNATIVGIKVEVEAKASVNGPVSLDCVGMVKGGTILGCYYTGAASLATSDAYYSFGGSSVLWGTTWTYSNINASNFGVVVYATNYDTVTQTAYIDHIRITVYYTTPSNVDWIMSVSSTTGALTIMPSFANGMVILGSAGSKAGIISLAGSTSGNVTIQTAAAAGTWTLTLPTNAGTSGYQLTTNGYGVTSWAAASSLRSMKNIIGKASPNDALNKILHATVYRFHYKPGMGTGDTKTEYVGIMADEAPWAMHYNNSVVNPVNTLGYMVLGIQGLNQKIESLKQTLETKNVVAEKVRAENFELVDKKTGEVYCVWIENGELKKEKGGCE